MDDKIFAKQLRKPTGAVGKYIGNVMNNINSFMNTYTYNKMNINEGDRILEIGFGNGQFISQFFNKESKISYSGIELSKIMIEEAEIRNKELISKGQIDLKYGNVASIPFENSKFNKVCTINTVYFFEDLGESIKEMQRVLIAGGHLYIAMRMKEKLQLNSFVRYFPKVYDFDEIETILAENGFLNVTKDYCVEPGNNDNKDVLLITAEKK